MTWCSLPWSGSLYYEMVTLSRCSHSLLSVGRGCCRSLNVLLYGCYWDPTQERRVPRGYTGGWEVWVLGGGVGWVYGGGGCSWGGVGWGVAATKQLYEWSSPSVRPSVPLSVRHNFFTMFPIIVSPSGVITNDRNEFKRSRSEVKGQGHRG